MNIEQPQNIVDRFTTRSTHMISVELKIDTKPTRVQ